MEDKILIKPEIKFTVADTAFAFAMLVCGFLYWNLIHLHMLGAGVSIFAVVMFAVSFIYLSKSGIKQNAGSLTCLILAVLSAAQFALFDNKFINGLNFIFLSAVFIYWICLSTGRQIDKELSAYIIGDAVKQGVSMPFLNFGCCASGVKNFSKDKKVKKILPAFVGIIVCLPLIAVVIILLMSADWAFENFISRVFDFITIESIIIYTGQFIIGIPVAFYLYGLIYGNVKGRYADKITAESVDRAAKIIKIAPEITIYSMLTMFNIIYLIFFAVQAAYLFSAFGGNLPETFTYAEYARRGFFELCAVAGINLGILIVSHLTLKKEHGEEEPKMLQVEITIISVLTIFLIATALSKMVMYINAYGLTQLRVFTSWFMILLLFIFAMICVRQFKKFNLVKFVTAGFILMFMALSYGNVDGLIARYNISRCEAGTLSIFDIDMINGLSDAAVPHIYDMYLRTDENDFEMRRRLASSIMNGRLHEISGFREFNFQRYRADEIRVLVEDANYPPWEWWRRKQGY